MFSKYLLSCFVFAVFALESISSVAIYRDTDVIKKSQRGGKQLNDFIYGDDDYSLSRYRPDTQSGSRWESAEWPHDLRGGHGGNRDSSFENGEPDYNWYYHNKFITNGRFNHLYNGPHLDNRAGIGNSFGSGNQRSRPQILPRPQSSVGRAFKY